MDVVHEEEELTTDAPGAAARDLAARAHDVATCLEGRSVAELDQLPLLGMAVRLALHLRGAPPVKADVVRKVCVYLLAFPSAAVRPVLELLAEAEFVQLVTEGRTLKTVIPRVPFYERLFEDLGTVVDKSTLNEAEQLTVDLMQRLGGSPLLSTHAYELGAERRLVDRVLDIGDQGSYILKRRARGRDVLVSPAYFSESTSAYADLVAAEGSARIRKVLALLRTHQGWPLTKIVKEARIGDDTLETKDVDVIRMLAGDGFVAPPAIKTRHAGTNHFLFGPRPGPARLPPFKKPVYEAAMALVAAVRQGQLLPARFRIFSPTLLLRALKERGFVRASSEAFEQYRQVAALRVGRLVQVGSRYRFELVQRPENIEAVDLALAMVSGGETGPASDDEITLALRRGESYVESLIGRKRLVEHGRVEADDETRSVIDEFFLRGAR